MKTRVAEMIDKEIVIALAKEAGFEMWVDDLQALCNLAVAHAQKDAEPPIHVGDSRFEGWFSEYDSTNKGTKQQMRDSYAAGMSDCGEAGHVEGRCGNLHCLPRLAAIRGAVARGWCSPSNAHKEMDVDLALAIADEVYAINPAHDDIALLRQALEALEQISPCVKRGSITITALRERLGEVK